MKEYLISVIGICALCFLIKQISFDTDKRYISFICGLCVIVVVAKPINKAIYWLSSFEADTYIEEESYDGEEYKIKFEEYLKGEYINEIKESIKNDICNKYSLGTECVDINLGVSNGELKKIIITLRKLGIFANSNDMKGYIEGKYGCVAEIIIGG